MKAFKKWSNDGWIKHFQHSLTTSSLGSQQYMSSWQGNNFLYYMMWCHWPSSSYHSQVFLLMQSNWIIFWPKNLVNRWEFLKGIWAAIKSEFAPGSVFFLCLSGFLILLNIPKNPSPLLDENSSNAISWRNWLVLDSFYSFFFSDKDNGQTSWAFSANRKLLPPE